MIKNSIIPKSISFILLGVMLYMHLCSAFCATGYFFKKEFGNQVKRICCADKNNDNEKSSGCQDMHFSFFNTTGQFHYDKPLDITISFPVFIIDTTLLNIFSVSQRKICFTLNDFYPPPPEEDIRILIKSFQI